MMDFAEFSRAARFVHELLGLPPDPDCHAIVGCDFMGRRMG